MLLTGHHKNQSTYNLKQRSQHVIKYCYASIINSSLATCKSKTAGTAGKFLLHSSNCW